MFHIIFFNVFQNKKCINNFLIYDGIFCIKNQSMSQFEASNNIFHKIYFIIYYVGEIKKEETETYTIKAAFVVATFLISCCFPFLVQMLRNQGSRRLGD